MTHAGFITSPVQAFEVAADAVVAGDASTLRDLLSTHPELVRARSARPHRATLLHYVGANGVEQERQRSPDDAAAIASILLTAGADIDALADIYGSSTTLTLVASSSHPKRAGVQIALMETLLSFGADINGRPGSGNPLLSALRNGHGEAAEFLAERGAELDLEGAAGVGHLEIVERLLTEDSKEKTQDQLHPAFLWACEYGRNDVIHLLLQHGVGVQTDVQTTGNTGLSGLHWAIVGGQLETVELLLNQGASLVWENAYGGTALGQALWSAENAEPAIDYLPIIRLLRDHGAK